MSFNHKRSAFSLIELLVVMAIISLLLAILLPAIAASRTSAEAAACGSNLRQVGVAFAMYQDAHSGLYPAADDPVRNDPTYWLWMGRGFRLFIGPYLVDDISAQNPSVLVCPSDPTSSDVFERTSYAYSMSFYHSPEQIDAMTRASDCYSNPQPNVAQSATHVRQPSRKILSGEWESLHKPLEDDQGWWDARGRRVFLLADSHVAIYDAEQIFLANDGLPDPHLTLHGVEGVDVP